MELHMQEFIDW